MAVKKDLNQTLITNVREERRIHDDNKRQGEELGKPNSKKITTGGK